MAKNRILILGLNQLPHRYLYNQCGYLAREFDLTVVSPYEGFGKKASDLFRIVYLDLGVQSHKNKWAKKLQTMRRIFRIIHGFKKHLKHNDYDLIYIWDQTWAFAIKLLLGSKHKYVMQMFAQGVTPSPFKNAIHDAQVRFNVLFFSHVFVGSEHVIRLFKVPFGKAHVTGVGVDAIDYQDRVFDSMDLVYLGGLTNRYVHESVEGFVRFYKDNRGRIPMSYKIIGSGVDEAVQLLKASIAAAGPEVPVQYLGRLDDADLISVFRKSNIGVAYHKITPYYTNNISNKLYEYLLSGMPVIASRSNSMIQAINDNNGVLIEDTPEGFMHGLATMMGKLNTYDSKEIVKTALAYSVKTLVEDRMIPAFNKIIQERK